MCPFPRHTGPPHSPPPSTVVSLPIKSNTSVILFWLICHFKKVIGPFLNKERKKECIKFILALLSLYYTPNFLIYSSSPRQNVRCDAVFQIICIRKKRIHKIIEFDQLKIG
jgi:hypothetical protein